MVPLSGFYDTIITGLGKAVIYRMYLNWKLLLQNLEINKNVYITQSYSKSGMI